MAVIALVLKSPTDRIAPFPLECQACWTVRQLKNHISVVYPGKPPCDTQKVIYAGKLLNDDQHISDIFEPNTSTIVHFICQASVVAGPETDANGSKSNEMTLDQYSDLYREYQAYVQNFYLSSSQSGTAATAAMSQYQQMMWMNQAYVQSCAQYMAAQYQQQSYGTNSEANGAAVNSSTAKLDVEASGETSPTAEPANTVTVAPEEPAPRQRLRQDNQPRANVGAMAVQNMMAAAFEGGDEVGDGGGEPGEGEPRDALHYLYVLVRFGLLLLICYYYSSLASVLTTLVLFSLFFGVNLMRRNNNQPPQPPVANDDHGSVAPAVADPVVGDDNNDHILDSAIGGAGLDNQVPVTETAATTVRPPSDPDVSQSTSGIDCVPQRAGPSAVLPVVTISQRLRQAACTSLQFVMAFFVTLFPEPIAHIDLH